MEGFSNKPIKILHLNIYFNLPDDFQGDMNDAIEELLKYRKAPKNHDFPYIQKPELSIFSNYWQMIQTTNRKLYGEVSLTQFNHETQKYEDIEQK